ncbi:hypothetical protein VNO78_20177 [Psophocarpus tetragonolobus]|uniref:Uncharacterized protein n=1 Tax=Psophocarpus tetragonolobus TaxID=3891 RepID=A0AAN9S9X4_PSOTE
MFMDRSGFKEVTPSWGTPGPKGSSQSKVELVPKDPLVQKQGVHHSLSPAVTAKDPNPRQNLHINQISRPHTLCPVGYN